MLEVMKPLNPDELRMIDDGAEVQLLLLHLGILDCVINKAAEYHAQYDKQAGISMYYKHHQTHWLIVQTYWGLSKRDDNGYAIVAVPKSKFSRERFFHLAAQLSRQLHLGEINVETGPIKKPSN